MTERKNGLTYADSGVDIDAGNRLVDLIKPMVRATARPGADAEIGGFGGLFDLKAAGFKDPVLVAATDGVGTKLKIAIETGIHGGIGIAAGKVKGVRVCTCSEPFSARMSRRHNNTNVLTFGARVIGVEMARMIVDEWLDNQYEGGRHQRRVDQLGEIENR